MELQLSPVWMPQWALGNMDVAPAGLSLLHRPTVLSLDNSLLPLKVFRCSSHVRLFHAAPWTVALQAPLFMGISQAKTTEWVAIHLQGVNTDPGTDLGPSLFLEVDSLLFKPPGKPRVVVEMITLRKSNSSGYHLAFSPRAEW